MTAYYNEHDRFAAAWLRELIADGLIAAGDVDERSILDVPADDLRGYTQVHFFAGIGGWSYALRLAGWPDDREVWTGSCPCQPLSSAGQQKGHDDERHLWPAFYELIAECRPSTVFGEQVASKLGREWLAGVRADLEDARYAVGAADLCAAGVGAPHIRQRLFWVGHADSGRQPAEITRVRQGVREPVARRGTASGLAHSDEGQRGRLADGEGRQHDGTQTGRQQGDGIAQSGSPDGGLAHPDSAGTGRDAGTVPRSEAQSGGGRVVNGDQPVGPVDGGATGGLADSDGGHASAEREQRSGMDDTAGEGGRGRGPVGEQGRNNELGGPSPDGGLVNPKREGLEGHGDDRGQFKVDGGPPKNPWSSSELIPCADGKARRVEPSVQPLAHGFPNRVGVLRGAGNAIVPQIAAAFVRATGV